FELNSITSCRIFHRCRFSPWYLPGRVNLSASLHTFVSIRGCYLRLNIETSITCWQALTIPLLAPQRIKQAYRTNRRVTPLRGCDASGGSSPPRARWHIREECYAQALACLIDGQNRQPLAAHWGQRLHILFGRPVLSRVKSVFAQQRYA